MYRELYSSKLGNISQSKLDELTDEFFPADNEIRISREQSESCEGPLTTEECQVALKAMESVKSPGSVGFPIEFYKIFWYDISTILLKAISCSFEKRKLSITQRSGIISLIPKDKLPYSLDNWRPITLLNCDYKIFAKAIANRIVKILISVINSDQTGFLERRLIGENIRIIEDIINFTDCASKPGLLLFLDFQKAFDSLEWSFIKKSFQYFNFGQSLISWIKHFYNDITSSVQNNGWVSEPFSLTRGVRQGCPLSQYLFIVAAEILGNVIRKKKEVKGIYVEDTEFKISQYADDTTLILNGSSESFLASLAVLERFGQLCGLKINYDKTKAFWIGTSRLNNKIKVKNKNIKWAEEKVKALGVWFTLDANNWYMSLAHFPQMTTTLN